MIDAVACALAGIRAVDPEQLVVRALPAYGITQGGTPCAVVAVGKAAAAMARGASAVLDDRITRGIIVAPDVVPTPPPHFVAYRGGHPIPNADGVRAALEVLALATSLSAQDTLVCLISGGMSALMTLPAEGISLDEMQDVTRRLLRAGATIDELNTVRKHLDQLKGGRLTRRAAPARIVALVLSDVIGDPLDVIASGPTVPDPSTVADAIQVLMQRGVWNDVAPAVRAHLTRGHDESPKAGEACFANATSVVIGNNTIAAQAACAHARTLGYEASVVTTTLSGEARDVGQRLAQEAIAVRQREPRVARCLVYGGETTVTVTGTGTGGRNQEVALGAALALDGHDGITVASLGTDGIDGPTDAAGAVADGQTLTRARAHGLDAHAALANNDAYPFWKALGDAVITGRTGTNVMDLIVVTIR